MNDQETWSENTEENRNSIVTSSFQKQRNYPWPNNKFYSNLISIISKSQIQTLLKRFVSHLKPNIVILPFSKKLRKFASFVVCMRYSSFFSIVRSDISVILVQNWHHRVSKSAKKIASTGYWTHNTNPTLRIPASLTTLPPRHLLNRISLNWTWIISGSIEHDFKRVWKFETGMEWQIGWVGKGAGILIVGLVLWVQYPVEAIFFCWFSNPVMSILYKNDRNVRSDNWEKTRISVRYRGISGAEVYRITYTWKHVLFRQKQSYKISRLVA